MFKCNLDVSTELLKPFVKTTPNNSKKQVICIVHFPQQCSLYHKLLRIMFTQATTKKGPYKMNIIHKTPFCKKTLTFD